MEGQLEPWNEKVVNPENFWGLTVPFSYWVLGPSGHLPSRSENAMSPLGFHRGRIFDSQELAHGWKQRSDMDVLRPQATSSGL